MCGQLANARKCGVAIGAPLTSGARGALRRIDWPHALDAARILHEHDNLGAAMPHYGNLPLAAFDGPWIFTAAD